MILVKIDGGYMINPNEEREIQRSRHRGTPKLNKVLELTKANEIFKTEILLIRIDLKTSKNIELTEEEIEFLYEIDKRRFDLLDTSDIEKCIKHGIESFASWADNIKRKRDIKKDMAFWHKCDISQVYDDHDTIDDPNNVVVYIGNIDDDHVYPNMRAVVGNVTCLKEEFMNKKLSYVIGNVDMPHIKNNSCDCLSLYRICGDANFPQLVDARLLQWLQYIGGNANFYHLIDSKGLDMLQIIGGDVQFDSLEDASGLWHLRQTKSFIAPELVYDYGLSSLKIIDGDADFRNVDYPFALLNLSVINGRAELYDEEACQRFTDTYISGEISLNTIAKLRK